MVKKFDLLISPTGETTIGVYCLKTDSWYDYEAFIREAEASLERNDIRAANRFLRAALTCLFSHVEGVVDDIERSVAIPKVYRGSRLCDRTRNIGTAASKRGSVPHLNFRLEKHLRDIISHPGINIAFPGSTPEVSLDQADVFERLDVATLRAFGSRISSWLESVCRNLGVSRFTDTFTRATEAATFFSSLGAAQVHEL